MPLQTMWHFKSNYLYCWLSLDKLMLFLDTTEIFIKLGNNVGTLTGKINSRSVHRGKSAAAAAAILCLITHSAEDQGMKKTSTVFISPVASCIVSHFDIICMLLYS